MALGCLWSFELAAMEYKVEIDNDFVHVAKAKIMPYEELGLHYDEHPQVVVAIQGGIITRLEADGTTTNVTFPTGTPVFRESEPSSKMHRSVNQSSEPIELMIIQLKPNKS